MRNTTTLPSRKELHTKIVESIQQCGWNVIFISPLNDRPFRIRIYNEDTSLQLLIYIWNLSPGGRVSLPDEYRIQVHVPRFEQQVGFKTLVLGWWNSVDVFAGFDYNKHSGLLGGSSSIQIKEEALRKAVINDVAAHDKGNDEITIAFRPDFFVDYVRGLEELHTFGQSAQDLRILEDVLDEAADETFELNQSLLQQVSQQRQTAVITLNKKVRDLSFKRRVLTAYSHQCAFCGIQLKLVDAAHIVPVSHEASTDQTCNGIALCALHHRAFDNALVTLNEQYQIKPNPTKLSRLTQIGHDGGLAKFLSDLKPIINVPPALTDRPLTGYITHANKLRGW